MLVDVRSAPGSRRSPQFGRGPLTQALAEAGIDYRHEPALGGFRRPRPDSPNAGWENGAFRGYADHMASEEFAAALDRLQSAALERSTAVMCAEAQWWRCHRRLIADALLLGGWRVLHLGLHDRPIEHELTPFAVVSRHGELTYPPARMRPTAPADRP